MNLLTACSFIVLVNILIWFSTNLQLVEGWSKKDTLQIAILLAIPISSLSYFATEFGFKALGSLWSFRLLTFGLSYLVFPILTWIFLRESPFSVKTMTCIGLSILIVLIQIFLPDT